MEVVEHRRHGVLVEFASEIDIAWNTVLLTYRARQVTQSPCCVTRPEMSDQRAGGRIFRHARRRPVQRQVEAEVAAGRGLLLPGKTVCKVRDHAFGDVHFHRREPVRRRCHEHQRLEDFFLRCGLAMRAREDLRPGGCEPLALCEQVRAPEVAPDSILDQAITQQYPFDLKRERAQGAPRDHG